MSPSSRLRLSIDSEAYDATQMYAHAHHHNNTTTYDRVFIDSNGQAHDPDFVSHIFPNPTAADIRARRRAKKARRLSQTGLIQDVDSDDEDASDSDLGGDPFRSYTASRRAAQSYYAPTTPVVSPKTVYPATPAAYKQYDQQRRSHFANTTPTSSASSSPPSWQYTASLLHEEDHSPSSRRVRRWSHSKKEDGEERRRLRKRRNPLGELNEDESDDDDDEERAASRTGTTEEDPEDCAPTCMQALRRQWQSLIIRITLSTHRTKRRIIKKNISRPITNEKFGSGT